VCRANSIPAAFVVNALLQIGTTDATPARETALFKGMYMAIVCAMVNVPNVWADFKGVFLRQLIRAAALSHEENGGGNNTQSRSRANSFADWGDVGGGDVEHGDEYDYGGGDVNPFDGRSRKVSERRKR